VEKERGCHEQPSSEIHLILPVNIPRFVEKAYLRGADAVMLDLEDAVPLQEKESARRLIKDSLSLAGRGGAEVLVPEDLSANLERPGPAAA
jgi:hypothetical protein